MEDAKFKTFNLLKMFKKLQSKVVSEDIKGFIIDSAEECFVLSTGSYGYVYYFDEEESKFFTETTTLSHEEFNRLMALHINVEGKPDKSIKIAVTLSKHGYDFRNHIQDGFEVALDSRSNIERVVGRVVRDFSNEKRYNVAAPAVNVGKLRRALEGFDNSDTVYMLTKDGEIAGNKIPNDSLHIMALEKVVFSKNNDQRVKRSFLLGIRTTGAINGRIAKANIEQIV